MSEKTPDRGSPGHFRCPEWTSGGREDAENLKRDQDLLPPRPRSPARLSTGRMRYRRAGGIILSWPLRITTAINDTLIASTSLSSMRRPCQVAVTLTIIVVARYTLALSAGLTKPPGSGMLVHEGLHRGLRNAGCLYRRLAPWFERQQ